MGLHHYLHDFKTYFVGSETTALISKKITKYCSLGWRPSRPSIQKCHYWTSWEWYSHINFSLKLRTFETNMKLLGCIRMSGLHNTHRLKVFAGAFIESTRSLKRTFCRLPVSPLELQTSPDFTDLITHNSFKYRHDFVEFFMNVTITLIMQKYLDVGYRLWR